MENQNTENGNKVDHSALARKMLEWEALAQQMNLLAEEIFETVTLLRKTQTVGNVRATFNQGRKTYNYKAVRKHSEYYSPELEKMHTIEKIDFKAICEATGFEAPFVQGDPKVTIKLLERKDK